MDKLDLNFENGFWLPDSWRYEDIDEPAVVMWNHFRAYCRSKGEYNEVVLLTEFNAKAQRYAADEDGYDDQWFVKFATPEDYTFFVMRFG